MDSLHRRFEDLLSLMLDGSSAEAEQEELARLIQDNPQRLSGSFDSIFTHSLLQWRSADISECLRMERDANESEGKTKRLADNQQKMRHRYRWMAVAAILLIAFGIASWQHYHSPTVVNTTIAEIVAQDGVSWAKDSTALKSGNLLATGSLRNDAGSYTLRFRSGPTVRIAGPSTLNIQSAKLIHLHRGQATARIPEGAKGFAIKTPVARLVDRGTEFGVVARNDGKTDVIVFEGRVDVWDMGGPKQAPRSLLIGDGARIDEQGSIDRIMQIGRNTTGSWWTKDSAPEKYLIESVTDNIVSDVSDKFVCYQTSYGGLRDDALAYADNPHHQWNGLTAEGLPEFLRGADYIKTFNDYRYRQDFEMTVVVSSPTNLYVLADNRIPAPPWLTELFEDTGVDIGLDEGPWLDQAAEKFRELDVNTTAIGGGKSIDNTFSVWLRRCLEPSAINLGDAGKWATEGGQGRAMYGVAATPLKTLP